MTLDEAVKIFEAKFDTVQEGPPRASLDDGTSYLTVVIGGVKPFGATFPCHCMNEDVAARLWLEAAIAATAGKKNLWWRERPITDKYFIRRCEPGGIVIPGEPAMPMFAIYSRLIAT